MLKQLPDQRAVILGQYIIENKSTVRAAAKKFGISKSTVHKDVSERLKKENPALYAQVKDILEINKQERHIRGGMATKLKYEKIAENKMKYKYWPKKTVIIMAVFNFICAIFTNLFKSTWQNSGGVYNKCIKNIAQI